ncbi:Uncharacterized protein TCM_015754 [Theobroma cacao]|uniref:Uncharacterized protein n=1 Tax=Theobroma cacao TaxID=3641 RepID=A0A061G4D6_THECC|nr:Uncharacterized protein TCM_015754 [Theobroma cacao]
MGQRAVAVHSIFFLHFLPTSGRGLNLYRVSNLPEPNSIKTLGLLKIVLMIVKMVGFDESYGNNRTRSNYKIKSAAVHGL